MADRSSIDRTIDAVDDFAARYRRPIVVLGGIWFVLSWASTSGFIKLPEIPFVTGKLAVVASSMFIGLWWGFINPRITRRRAERLPNTEVANG